MSQYRIYVLNAQDCVAAALERLFRTDREALEKAEDLSAGQYAAEVWQGERLVARLGGAFLLSESWLAA